MIKSGYQTSEFWVTILTFLLPLLNGLFKWNLEVDKTAVAVTQIIVSVAYIYSRIKVKATTNTVPKQ